MKKIYFTILNIATTFLLLSSCRSNDTDNTLNPDSRSAAIEVNFMGTDFADPDKPELTASLKGISATRSSVDKPQIIMLDPGTFISTEATPVASVLNKQASLKGAQAAIAGDPLGNGMQFRVIAYESTGGVYAAHKDYQIVSGAATPMSSGALYLDQTKTYDMVVYSYGSTALPAITPAETNNISGASAAYINNSDMMYTKMTGQKFTIKGNNPFNFTLRHKTAMIESVKLNAFNPLTIKGYSIAETFLSIPHYTDGNIAFSGAGNITGRTNRADILPYNNNMMLSGIKSRTDHEMVFDVDNLLVNTDTTNGFPAGDANGKVQMLSMDIGVADAITGLTSTRPITARFRLRPEYKHKLTINIQKCGAYTAPGVWKQFACHNLGADTTLDPFTPAAGLHGDKYQWGAAKGEAGRYISMADDQTIVNYTPWSLSGKPANSWNGTNDPCFKELGTGWRVPTRAEWQGVLSNNPRTDATDYPSMNWTQSSTNYASGIKFGTSLFLPAIGFRWSTSPSSLSERGFSGRYRSVTGGIDILQFSKTTQSLNTYSGTNDNALGLAIRCIKD
ncbi:fimbrillin family protein [Elizabethkingia ursingii]|uniref:fimbrillin family protein n=1 Tax=Elizabethkingia ursingii TaxID=1756150 RepID=UPI002012D0C9|nr:fimbrillin family protein [Elizabethkingia ursingii]MCL1670892.1 fimbrillin family protein [Elizabethkingia ursingii]